MGTVCNCVLASERVGGCLCLLIAVVVIVGRWLLISGLNKLIYNCIDIAGLLTPIRLARSLSHTHSARTHVLQVPAHVACIARASYDELGSEKLL